MPELVTVKVKTTVTFKSFVVPNFAVYVDSEKSTPIKELGQEVLDALAGSWLDQLYQKAGKTNPFRQQAYRG